MAKVLKTVAIVAGTVALVATGLGAVGVVAAATAAAIAAVASLVSTVASLGARALTKPPPQRGSVSRAIIEPDPPAAYLMGEGYFAGVMRHRVGYGATLKKVPNPYLFEAMALCAAGPIEGPIIPQVDFGPVPSWYNGFLATDTRLGAVPETAITPQFDANAPGWSTNHKLSGIAAIGWGHKFDKDGERFASGLPTRGVLAKWVKVYDPRKDSTRAGGSGAHRVDDEGSWEWSENPALHAGTYAFGRYHPQTGNRIFGIGLPDDAIDWEAVAAWANDCDANGWRMFGEIFEGGRTGVSERWDNLTDICVAGGAQPLFSGAVLGFHWNRPRVMLDTIAEADLAEGPQEVTAMQSLRDRLNTVRPIYMQPANNWERLPGDEIQVASYLAEDGGEPRAESVPFNFVKDHDQAAQLGAYWVANARELTPITLTCMPRMRAYRPGEGLRLDLPQLGLDHDAVILKSHFDPAQMTVTLTLITETAGKHAFALGQSATAPATPAIGQSAQERDQVAARTLEPVGFGGIAISGSYPRGLAGQITQTHNGDGTVEVVIPAHERVYSNTQTVAVNGGTLTLAEESDFLIFYDDENRAGGGVSFGVVDIANGGTAADAYFSATNPDRHFVASVSTVAADGSGGSSGGSSPPGGGGWSGVGGQPFDPDLLIP